MQLPTGCLCEHDGCDEAELLARAKRCQEIMRLSQQATEAEAERVRVANIKPLIWAKPTFEFVSTTACAAVIDTNAAEEIEAASLGKRKERQEEAKLPQNTIPPDGCHPRRKPTPEEVQVSVDFTNKRIPSAERRYTESPR